MGSDTIRNQVSSNRINLNSNSKYLIVNVNSNRVNDNFRNEIKPARLKCEWHCRISERISLTVDGAKRNSEMVWILFRKLRNVIGDLSSKCKTKMPKLCQCKNFTCKVKLFRH